MSEVSESMFEHIAELTAEVAALEAQLTACREREGRMREALEAYVRADSPDEVEKAAKTLAALAAEKEDE